MVRWLHLTCLAAFTVAPALVGQDKLSLNHDAYEIWKYIDDERLSSDGRWLAYALTVLEGDGTLEITSTDGRTTYSVPRGRDPRFTSDNRFVVFRIAPEHTMVEAAQDADEEEPSDSLGIITLGDAAVHRVGGVKTFDVPEDGDPWVVYHMAATDAAGDSSETEPVSGDPLGTSLVIRDLRTEREQRFEYVIDFRLAASGTRVVYATRAPDDSVSGVFAVTPGESAPSTLLIGSGDHAQLAVSEDGTQAAFVSDHEDHDAEQPSFTLYHWRHGAAPATAVVASGHGALPPEWGVSKRGSVSFSKSGARLFFGTAPRPQPEAEDDPTGGVTLDVWHWQDPYLQPQLLLEADADRNRTYLAVVLTETAAVAQLARPDMPTVDVPQDGDAQTGIANSHMPYRVLTQWDYPEYHNVYLVDVASGARQLIAERLQSEAELSPALGFVSWWDRSAQAWFVYDRGTGEARNLSGAIPRTVADEEHDWPYLPSAYGSLWTEGDEALLVYDQYDIWAVDPTGRQAPRNVTEGVGRDEGLQLRYEQTDPEEEAVPLTEPVLLSALHLDTKEAGFYRDRIRGDRRPEALVMSSHRYANPITARDADVLLYTRESFQEFPNLWLSDGRLRNPRRLTDANPQQSEYLWGTAELVTWTSTDGIPLQGVLYKPETFDPAQTYPMMVYFYEKNSETLHRHYHPEPHRSVINRTFYASRGYLVFVPDIVYRIGYPGESAMNAVMPGILSLMAQGFVDEQNIGVQGHSWGGYQIAYMVTQTNLFKAAEAGAPVANMTSAYGGIRWSSGMSRQWQYEKSQSRLGGSLWESPMRYIENSPLFWADKVETPLLIMHNDHDGAVPWYQGIELFTALRRLGKPTWLINYNDEPHWPTTYENKKDWNIRMQQFFDHYLQGAPAPEWLARGIPATQKGRTLGYELVDEPPTSGDGRDGRR